jgi:TonB family protein
MEAREVPMIELWKNWEGEAIDGAFPLRRLLGESDHSGVFLTEYNAKDLANAAIKIVPTDPALAEVQLSRWRTVAALSHSHLISLLHAGHCQRGDRQFVYVVMEYAEQTLSQILPDRALTPDEVREMLLPTLDALTFLHRNNLVQGQLKPANVLVVDEQLKLSSDTIRPFDESTASISKSSLYDPPEAENGRMSAAGDIWALGITMVEALTQLPPEWPDENPETVSLPASIPATFVEAVRRCLSRDPAGRPTAAELEAQIKGGLPAPVMSIPQPVVRKATVGVTPPLKLPNQRLFVAAIAALFVLIVVWAGVRLLRSNRYSEQTATNTSPIASQIPGNTVPPPGEVSAVESKPAPAQQPSAADASLSVVHEEIPDVPRSASDTIHGHFQVAVRVIVDSSGNVVDETLEDPGPSKYFGRLATAAARKWKFAPAATHGSRALVVRFDFTRDGATGHAAVPP